MTIGYPFHAIDEPADDLLDALIDLIEARSDGEPDLAAWAVQALADGLGLTVTTSPAKPSPGLWDALGRHHEGLRR